MKTLILRRLRADFGACFLLATLKLREFETGNRLTSDQNGKRSDLAALVSKLEREWLFELLR